MEKTERRELTKVCEVGGEERAAGEGEEDEGEAARVALVPREEPLRLPPSPPEYVRHSVANRHLS